MMGIKHGTNCKNGECGQDKTKMLFIGNVNKQPYIINKPIE